MKFVLDDFETEKTGVNHWMIATELNQKDYEKLSQEMESALLYYESGKSSLAASKYKAVLKEYGLEALDAISILADLYLKVDVKKRVLEDGYNQIEHLLRKCGYKQDDRIEYGFITHRPLYRLWQCLAILYIYEKIDPDKGFELLEFIYSNNPGDNLGVRYELVWHYIQKGKFNQALNICKEFVNDECQDGEMAYAAALISLKREKLQEARRYFELAFISMPLLGHLLLEKDKELAKFVLVCGENEFTGGVIMGSLNESLIIYRKCWPLWLEHVEPKNQTHRAMIVNIVRGRK